MGEPDSPLLFGLGPRLRLRAHFSLPGNDSWVAPPDGETTHDDAESV